MLTVWQRGQTVINQTFQHFTGSGPAQLRTVPEPKAAPKHHRFSDIADNPENVMSHPAGYSITAGSSTCLTFWRRILVQILAHPVFKMCVIQKPKKVAL